ncbi:MAG: hypothetical protein AUG89_04685 [Acidobacteria bacterium 13_1_20CM_4_56_7]|nr:MAG: hypothetical protein AUG89_04685 [Acidobacteria bacterium 13_1_20CM_4_56_7]
MDDIQSLYRAVGAKIRAARENSAEKISQNKLSKRLDISRASIVNIEAGRQHAPLSLLWRIAEALSVELVTLVPRRAEMNASDADVKLSEKVRKQIALETRGDAKLQKRLTKIVGHMLTTIDAQKRGAHE